MDWQPDAEQNYNVHHLSLSGINETNKQHQTKHSTLSVNLTRERPFGLIHSKLSLLGPGPMDYIWCHGYRIPITFYYTCTVPLYYMRANQIYHKSFLLVISGEGWGGSFFFSALLDFFQLYVNHRMFSRHFKWVNVPMMRALVSPRPCCYGISPPHPSCPTRSSSLLYWASTLDDYFITSDILLISHSKAASLLACSNWRASLGWSFVTWKMQPAGRGWPFMKSGLRSFFIHFIPGFFFQISNTSRAFFTVVYFNQLIKQKSTFTWLKGDEN